MDLKDINYNVNRTENCVLVDITKWLDNSSNLLKRYNISGKDHVNYMTKVLKENIDRSKFGDFIQEGDSILISRIVSDVARYRAHSFGDGKKYYDVPIMQILGKFVCGAINFNFLCPAYDKLIMEKISPEYSKVLTSPHDNTTVCRVLKAGGTKFDKDWNKRDLTVKKGDIVLLKDNVATEIELDGKLYLASDEASVVAIFNDENNISLDNATMINESILMKQYVESKILGSSLLVTPEINYEDLDYSDIFNRDMLRVCYVDPNLTKLQSGDIVLLNRDLTNYVYFNREKYYILNGMDNIEGRKKGV